MTGPLDPVKGHEFWDELKKQELLFPDLSEESHSTDVISEMNRKIEELEDLCGRLSFSMRELSQVLKVQSTLKF